jgi:3-phosphoshikimate 1-carboxyvinyltransferase
MKARIYVGREGLKSGSLLIGGSKSESNRLLILQALFKGIRIENLSDSDDTMLLQKALRQTSGEVDIHHAGTAMRFLTAYYAATPGANVLLTGSARMKERPISLLVDALRDLGANISYRENEGYPPLHIKGCALEGGSVSIKASVSSQYISALLLIAPRLKRGLAIDMEGSLTSRPYVEMTCALLRDLGVGLETGPGYIRVYPELENDSKVFTVESDWSSASYFFSMAALSTRLNLHLQYYKPESIQGDSALKSIYEKLGVSAHLDPSTGSLQLSREHNDISQKLVLDLRNTPDIAQTLVITCLGLQIPCEFTGLHTLAIKETDRLKALKNEIGQLGSLVEIGRDYLLMANPNPLKKDVLIETYNDHRMAMAFAPLGLLVPIEIQDPGVVSKSFPTYWDCLRELGVAVDLKR